MTALAKLDLEQGCPEWHSLRKTKITATDANVIMGVSPWKTITQLYNEKLSNEPPFPPNERMKRGTDLEPIARDLFNIKTGWDMQPAVLVKDWAMASLDGRDDSIGCIVEIKCPGQKDHATAIQGKIPDHYYPQLQHQLYVAGVQFAYYFSFDGLDGVIVKVKRDDDYIEKMLKEEKKFYDCLMNKTPPEDQNDYIQRDDCLWTQCADKLRSVTESMKELEKEEQNLRNHLIFLSGDSNSRGAGISLCKVERKGAVDYSKIPEIKDIDLELYRKNSITSWRITCQ